MLIALSKRESMGGFSVDAPEFAICSTIPAFIIGKEGRHYAFGEAKVGVMVANAEACLTIRKTPYVLNLPYLHPNVYSDGKIDTDCMNLEETGVSFAKSYNLMDNVQKREFMGSIWILFQKAGYALKTICPPELRRGAPVYHLSRFTPIAASMEEVKRRSKMRKNR